MDASDRFDYQQGGSELLPRVKPLWEKLNRHHLDLSTYFKHHFSNFDFEERYRPLTVENGPQIFVDIVFDREQNRDAGYCLSTLTADGLGEIASLYIETDYRKLGFGEQLLERAMTWLQAHSASPLTITVAEGNENVLPFYRRHGFYPRKWLLEYVPPEQRLPEDHRDID